MYIYIYIFQRAKKLAIHHSAPSAFLPEETSDKLPPYADAIERATRGIVSSPPLSFHSLIFLEEEEEAIERAVENPGGGSWREAAAICSANVVSGEYRRRMVRGILKRGQ